MWWGKYDDGDGDNGGRAYDVSDYDGCESKNVEYDDDDDDGRGSCCDGKKDDLDGAYIVRGSP